NNYYRIKRVKINEKIEYSEIAKVLLPEFFTGIHVYPNPVKDENMNLQFIKQPAGKYNFILFNSIGQRIFLKELQFAGGNSIQTIYLKKSTPNGIYNLQIIKPDGEKIFLKVRK
ncbi:MAG: T9SS type A sorting domain-containing protein, partial [Ginsengibacter sp.]